MTDTRLIILRVTGGPNARNQIAFCAFHSLLVAVQINECWLHTCYACVITAWRLGLWAPFVARNNCSFVIYNTVSNIISAGAVDSSILTSFRTRQLSY